MTMIYVSNLYTYEQLLEREYLDGVLRSLIDLMGESLDSFEIVVFAGISSVGELDEVVRSSRKPVVLFLLSDECSSLPMQITESCKAVFKCYVSSERGSLNLHALPLGFATGMPRLPIKAAAERPLNVMFSGCAQPRRREFFSVVREMASRRHCSPPEGVEIAPLLRRDVGQDLSSAFACSVIIQTIGFRSGLNPREYATLLHSSKIALCPGGWRSNETFRLFEAMRAGCVIITSALPDVRIYRNAPVITMTDWKCLESCVDGLLEEPTRIAEIQEETCAWWQNVCSERAYAGFIAGVLLNCL